MATLINGEVGESLGYQFGVEHPNGSIFEFPTSVQAEKIASGIPGAKVKMRAVYATLWTDTTL